MIPPLALYGHFRPATFSLFPERLLFATLLPSRQQHEDARRKVVRAA
jgi:hypothetical protein